MARELKAALTAAAAAARIQKRWFRKIGAARLKADGSPVTRADLESERAIRTILRKAFPEDGILSEESAETPDRSGRRWIVDPLDGTRNFARGIPVFGPCIALEDPHGIAVGVMALPILGETYWAVRGKGAFCNGKRIRVSRIRNLSEGTLIYGNPDYFPRPERVVALMKKFHHGRGMGDLYGFALVARGSAEGMADPVNFPWDVAAAKLIVEEAGGRFTDLSGRDGRDSIRGGTALATNKLVHGKILRYLRAPNRKPK